MGGAMGWDKDDMILSLISWRTDRAFLCLLRNCVHTVCYVYFYIILSYKLRLDSCLPLIVFFLHLFVSLSLFFQFFFSKNKKETSDNFFFFTTYFLWILLPPH